MLGVTGREGKRMGRARSKVRVLGATAVRAHTTRDEVQKRRNRKLILFVQEVVLYIPHLTLLFVGRRVRRDDGI